MKQPRINMRAGYKVITTSFVGKYNALLVDNYEEGNEVLHMPTSLIDIDYFRDEGSIGIWKLKQLNKN